MSPDLVAPDRKPRSKWSCFLATGLTLFAVGVLLVFSLRWLSQRQEDRETKERWDRQVADLESGKTTCMIWPEPKFLENGLTMAPEGKPCGGRDPLRSRFGRLCIAAPMRYDGGGDLLSAAVAADVANGFWRIEGVESLG